MVVAVAGGARVEQGAPAAVDGGEHVGFRSLGELEPTERVEQLGYSLPRKEDVGGKFVAPFLWPGCLCCRRGLHDARRGWVEAQIGV